MLERQVASAVATPVDVLFFSVFAFDPRHISEIRVGFVPCSDSQSRLNY